MTDLMDYTTYLDQRMKREGPKRKGERTRDRLKVAASELLNEESYQELRITDICDRAGIAPGTFYLHYENKQILTIEILSEYVEMWTDLSSQTTADIDDDGDMFEAIYHTNLIYIQLAQLNPGLTRCVLQISDIEPEFAAFVHATSSQVYARTVAAIAKRTRLPSSPLLLLTINALGSMMDDIVRRLFVMRDPHLNSCISEMKMSTEDLAKHLTMIWYRSIFGEDPALNPNPAPKGRRKSPNT
ncbi:MAG: TetR/AcrR family transcriptional regulator [Parvibaculaceae bacterium]